MKEVMDIQWLEEVDSTNNEAVRRLGNAANLTVLAAVHQTAGRGQRGNSWLTHSGENLTFSMILKFGNENLWQLKARDQFVVSVAVTLGISDYLEAEGIECRIKWPNDIYVRNKKICGILIENRLNGEDLSDSVVGIGLNVNQKDFPPQLLNPVSMSLLTGKDYDNRLELSKLCGKLLKRLSQIESKSSLFNEYVCKLYRLGVFNEYVRCSSGELMKAKIVGVSESGLLRLETEKGELFEFAFKEISYVI